MKLAANTLPGSSWVRLASRVKHGEEGLNFENWPAATKEFYVGNWRLFSIFHHRICTGHPGWYRYKF